MQYRLLLSGSRDDEDTSLPNRILRAHTSIVEKRTTKYVQLITQAYDPRTRSKAVGLVFGVFVTLRNTESRGIDRAFC